MQFCFVNLFCFFLFTASFLCVGCQSGIRSKNRGVKRSDSVTNMTQISSHEVNKYYENISLHNYNILISCAYFGRKKMVRPIQWNNLVGIRTECLSKEEELKGKNKIEAFGIKYLPNAYAAYEKSRNDAIEVQQMFNEEFANLPKISDNSKRSAFEVILKGLVRCRTQFYRRHDELCHFYLMHKIGALTGDELTAIDNNPINIRLYEINRGYISFDKSGGCGSDINWLTANECVFAEKYTPESFAVYKQCELECRETELLLKEVLSDAKIMDIVRFELPVVACREKIDIIRSVLNQLSFRIKSLYLEHKSYVKDGVRIVKEDNECALRLRRFLKILPQYLRERANGPMVPVNNAMNEYYPNNTLKEWHWYALGFVPSENKTPNHIFEKSPRYHNDSSIYDIENVFDLSLFIDNSKYKDFYPSFDVGVNLDSPVFNDGLEQSHFLNQYQPGFYSVPVGVVRSVPFGIERISPNQICCTSNDDQMLQKVYLKMPITIALGAVLEQKGFEHSGIYVASFKHFSPLLSRLNEIDSGKYKYSRLLPKYNSQKNNMRSSNVVVTVVVK